MKYTEEQLESMVEGLQREVTELKRLLQGQQRYDFKYDNSEETYSQRTAKANIMSGDAFSSWQKVPIVSRLIAGDFITLSPATGVGDVTITAESGMTYDYVYVAGKPLAVPTRTTDFLKVYLDGTTTPEWVAAMPTVNQDSSAEIIDVTKNRIHFPGNAGRD